MLAIIDYGMGNVLSVQKALKAIGKESIITNNENEIKNSTHIILPGVGSFKQAMNNLEDRNLVTILKNEVIKNNKPFLGICLGMQLLADVGLEDGETPGLGLIGGAVHKIPANGLPVTHIGWNNITLTPNHFFQNINDLNFYFVHSYCFTPLDEKDISATVDYGGKVVAAVRKNNVLGTQFHPEKSQLEGLEVLKNFMTVC